MFFNNTKFISKPVKFRLMTKENNDLFVNEMNNSDFSNVYDINDPDEALQSFYDRLLKIYRKCFQIKKETEK